jgi:sirohydrochlorin cobaltochelatase
MRTGVLLVGHGSKLEENRRLVLGMAGRLEREGQFGPVVPCFMQINAPSVSKGLSVLAAMGVDTIYIQPCFLAGGIHISKDIPEAVGIEEGSSGGFVTIEGRRLELKYCRPIGEDDRLAGILSDRIRERMGVI